MVHQTRSHSHLLDAYTRPVKKNLKKQRTILNEEFYCCKMKLRGGLLVLVLNFISATRKLTWNPEEVLIDAIVVHEGLDHEIDSKFACVTLDWWPNEKCDYGNCSWVGGSINNLRFDDHLLIRALKSLNGRLRVGGTLSDQVVYKMQTDTDDCSPQFTPIDTEDKHHAWTDGCISRTRLDKLLNFAAKTETQMIFSLAALWGGRTNTTNWRPDNSLELLNHINQQNRRHLFYGFELGNEIYGNHGHAAQIPPDIAAQDFKLLRTILSQFKDTWKIFGTDTAMDIGWTKEFFSYGSDLVDIFTWHEYPLGSGGSSDVDAKVMDPKLTEKIIHRAETYKRKDALPKGIELWMGETGGAYGSGRNEVTNRFMSAFWYLDWLGVFSRLGYGGFCRQTLIGGNYGLLQIEKGEYFLNPDYFGALLFTHVMKGHIVKMNSSSEIHQYATIKRDGDNNAVYFGLLGTHSNLLI